ncbi:MAG: SGNH/GDSL hydrolase family protein [bacterium]|nr:SGNH/GDSL hydrolase family protein [bacterium]
MPLPRLMIIGDSISVQYGPYLARDVAAFFDLGRPDDEAASQALADLDIPRGSNIGDSAVVLEAIEKGAREGGLGVDVLLLNCGLHDIKTDPATGAKQVPLEQYEDNLRRVVELVGAMRTRLIWVRTTPAVETAHNKPEMTFHRYAADVRAYNAAADRIMTEAGVPEIDLYRFTVSQGPDIYCDHVHFKEEIRARQAAYIAGWLEAWLKGPGSDGGDSAMKGKTE